MPPTVTLCGLTTLVLALSACQIANEGEPELYRSALRADLVGCYALWTGRGERVGSSFWNASPVIYLDSTPHQWTERDTVPGTLRMLVRLDTGGRPIDPPEHRDNPFRGWWADSLTDSIRLSFSDGFSGAQLVLSGPSDGPDTLRGRIVELWDFQLPTKEGPAYATRVQCRDE